MKKNKSKKLNHKNAMALLLCLVLNSILSLAYAQDVVLVSGGDATGSGGTANYSVGQIVQTTITGTSGSAIQGVQFYFESETLTIVDVATNMNITTYPNPASSSFNLRVSGHTGGELTYKLYNLLGVVMSKGKVTDGVTQIDIDDLPLATYMLTINNKDKTIKTFKIIKNQPQ